MLLSRFLPYKGYYEIREAPAVVVAVRRVRQRSLETSQLTPPSHVSLPGPAQRKSRPS
jgi:hypothetical protein